MSILLPSFFLLFFFSLFLVHEGRKKMQMLSLWKKSNSHSLFHYYHENFDGKQKKWMAILKLTSTKPFSCLLWFDLYLLWFFHYWFDIFGFWSSKPVDTTHYELTIGLYLGKGPFVLEFLANRSLADDPITITRLPFDKKVCDCIYYPHRRQYLWFRA
jgi:hypothetical protein